jgi:hypothetical protein
MMSACVDMAEVMFLVVSAEDAFVASARNLDN